MVHVPLVFRFNHFQEKNAFFWIFLYKTLILKDLILQGLRSTFVTKIRMQKILVILRFYWNLITLVLIWKVLRRAFRWCHYFLNPSTFGWVISLFEIFSKYLQSL
jgi:hypothetical protein